MQQYWAQNPGYKVAYDQLLNGPNNVATSGSVIGNYTGARDALRDAENSMFLQGTGPEDGAEGRRRRTRPRRSTTTTPGSAG